MIDNIENEHDHDHYQEKAADLYRRITDLAEEVCEFSHFDPMEQYDRPAAALIIYDMDNHLAGKAVLFSSVEPSRLMETLRAIAENKEDCDPVIVNDKNIKSEKMRRSYRRN